MEAKERMRHTGNGETDRDRRGDRPAGRSAALAAAVVTGLFWGCGDSITGPGSGGIVFSEQIPLGTLQTEIDQGARRVEIKLLRGTLVAREVELEEAEERADREEVKSRVTAIDGGAGMLTLELGDLVVTFDAATEFRLEGGAGIDLAGFVSRIETSLAGGDFPAVEAKRPPAAEPQAPDDPTFLATRIEIDDEADEPEIEINIDGDNLVASASPPPDAILTVLGLPIEIRASDGTTELERERDRDDDETEFEGIVSSVDEAAGTATLADGTIIRIVQATEIEREGDDDNLTSLGAVAAALAQGALVEAEGEGVVESADPRTIVAKEVEFEIEDDSDDIPGNVEFESDVVSVDEVAGSVVLANGTVVRIDAGTRIDGGSGEDPGSLAEVAAAIAGGERVVAEGEGIVESTSPRVILAKEIEFEIDD